MYTYIEATGTSTMCIINSLLGRLGIQASLQNKTENHNKRKGIRQNYTYKLCVIVQVRTSVVF